jgi:hypothetical protein
LTFLRIRVGFGGLINHPKEKFMKQFYLHCIAIICALAFDNMALALDSVSTPTPFNQLQANPSTFSAKDITPDPCSGEASSPAIASCGLTGMPVAIPFDNNADNNLRIAPYCVQYCIDYPDNRAARCYTRCSIGFFG